MHNTGRFGFIILLLLTNLAVGVFGPWGLLAIFPLGWLIEYLGKISN